MSLINKMLQDLDARGTPAGDAFPAQIKPVEREPHRLNLRAVAAAVGGSLAGLALAWFGWAQYQQYQQRQAPVPAATRPAASQALVHAAAAAAQEAVPAGAAAPRSVEPLEPDSVEARAARQALARELDARADALKARIASLAAAPPAQDVEAPAPAPPARRTASGAQRAAHAAPEVRQAAGAKPRAEPAAKPREPAPAQATQAATRAPGPNVRAEAEYRRALASLQDGRMTETVASLEQALKIDPAHEAARQTLVGLLVEAGRGDDAMRQLQLGLTLDPRQPALAMLLARLQIEHGGNGIDTLNRTLPYAGNNADYRAFLAGALQRQQRHREAAEQYQAALRGAPGNAVWWMGLGMSLQADKRNGEALDAFQKARAAGLPSQELQTFVERRIAQLGR